jgi:hypothetical protein
VLFRQQNAALQYESAAATMVCLTRETHAPWSITVAKKAERGVKSQAIRDYLKSHKRAKASDVVAALAEKGIEVSTAMVYNLKARRNMGRRRRKAVARGEKIRLSIDHLLAAKKFVETTGGVEQAQEALAAYLKLT